MLLNPEEVEMKNVLALLVALVISIPAFAQTSTNSQDQSTSTTTTQQAQSTSSTAATTAPTDSATG